MIDSFGESSIPQPVVNDELALVRRDTKNGHSPRGKKDVADGVAGAVWHAERAFARGVKSQWLNVTTITPSWKVGFADDNDKLWDKVYRGISLTEEEIVRIHRRLSPLLATRRFFLLSG